MTLRCGADKMAAPRRPREEKEQEDGDLLEAKRVRGQRRLLVVLEGASLETVKVRTKGIGPGRGCSAVSIVKLSVLWP